MWKITIRAYDSEMSLLCESHSGAEDARQCIEDVMTKYPDACRIEAFFQKEGNGELESGSDS